MQTEIMVNRKQVFLNDFAQNYIAHILFGISNVFGERPSTVTVLIDEKDISIYSDGKRLSFERDFAEQLIKSTLMGMLSPLKGILLLEEISIISCA